MILIPLFCSFCKYCIFVSIILDNIDEQYSNNGAIIALYTTHLIYGVKFTLIHLNIPSFEPIKREREKEREGEIERKIDKRNTAKYG